MFEDLLPMSRWKRTAVFNEFYSRLRCKNLSLSLTLSRRDIIGVVAHRKRAPFTERDRSMLNLLRFHLSEACSTAKGCPIIAFPSVLEALESLVGGSIVRWTAAARFSFALILLGDILSATSRMKGRFRMVSPDLLGAGFSERWRTLRVMSSEFGRRSLSLSGEARGRFIFGWRGQKREPDLFCVACRRSSLCVGKAKHARAGGATN